MMSDDNLSVQLWATNERENSTCFSDETASSSMLCVDDINHIQEMPYNPWLNHVKSPHSSTKNDS